MSRKKRGISTIIGGMFFLLAVISSLSVMSWTLQQQAKLTTTTTEVNALQMERQLSDLEVTEIKIDNGKFNATLQNNGPQTDRVVRMWITNETAANWHQKYDIDYIVNPKQTISNIGQNLPVAANDLKAYKFSLVTEKGNIIPFRTLSVAQANLRISMYIIPSTISTGENVTIMMSVTNNERDVNFVHNLQPTMSLSYTCVLLLCPTAVQKVAPSSTQFLPRDSTALFKWIYAVTGPATSKVTFTGSLVGGTTSASDGLTITSVTADAASVTSIITSSAGQVMMSFSTFQYCNPSPPGVTECGSISLNWQKGWQIAQGTSYIWRINITNTGSKPIIVEQNTALLALQAQQGGGGNLPHAFFLKSDSFPLDERASSGNAAYTNYNKVLPVNPPGLTIYTTMYFGVSAAGGNALQSPFGAGDTGIYAVNLILFGYEDQNSDGIYTAGIDTPYSQNLPFQGLRVS